MPRSIRLIPVCLVAVLLASAAPRAISSGIVISQVYGGGGNSGATYRNDFIELFNRGTVAVSVAGWSGQYASSTGSSGQVTGLSGSIPAGGYYLVQQGRRWRHRQASYSEMPPAGYWCQRIPVGRTAGP